MSTGLLNDLTMGEAASVFRHELAHAYKQVRSSHVVKNFVESSIPFTNAAHTEERRADFFAPRNPKDLRDLATALEKMGNVFEAGERTVGQAFYVLQQQGLLDKVAKDFGEQYSKAIGSEGGGITKWATRKAGKFTGQYMERKLRKSYDDVAALSGIMEIKEDGSVQGRDIKRFTERDEKTHPSVVSRVADLREGADKMEVGLGMTPRPASKVLVKPRGASHRQAVIDVAASGDGLPSLP